MSNSKTNFQQTREVVYYALEYVHGRTLDLGAGTAKYRDILRERAASYETFDLVSGEHIDRVGDITRTGYPDNHFDTILSTQVLEHVPAPWDAVREMYRITAPGGACIITAPFMQPYHADPHDYYRYTVEGMKSLCTSVGFEVVEAGYYTKLFSVIAEAIHHTVFSPYKPPRRGGARVVKLLSALARRADRFVRCARIYGNVYCIVRKPPVNHEARTDSQ